MLISPVAPRGAEAHNAKTVRLYRDGEFVATFGTFSDCAASIGCSVSTVHRCLMHDKPFRGYTFQEGGAL